MQRFRALRAAALVTTVLLVLGPASMARADGTDGGGGQTSMTGVVETLPSGGLIGNWVVNGTTVQVTQSTELPDQGSVAVGATVQVEGVLQSDGSILATSIDLAEASGDDSYGTVELKGVVQSMPSGGLVGDWVVSGVTVHVTDTTQIDTGAGTPAVGSSVEVKGLGQPDGSVTALTLEVQSEQSAGDGCAESLSGVMHTTSRAGVITVSHHRVRITSTTRIVRNGHRLASGRRVTVSGHLRRTGVLVARRIVVG